MEGWVFQIAVKAIVLEKGRERWEKGQDCITSGGISQLLLIDIKIVQYIYKAWLDSSP